MVAKTLFLKEIIIFPELFLGISLIYLIIHCSFLSIQKSYPLIQNSTLQLSLLILFFSCTLIALDPLGNQEFSSFNNSFVNDYFSYLSKFISGILVLFWMFACQTYIIKNKINNFEYIILILFSVLGMFVLCSSNDLITAYLAIELQSLSFYVLASYKKNSTFSVESGIKYFILGSLASSFFLFGSSLIYGLTGTINFEDLKDLFFNFFVFEVDYKNLELIPNLIYYNTVISYAEPLIADKIINNKFFLDQFPSLFEVELFKDYTNNFSDCLIQYRMACYNVSFLLSHLIVECNMVNLFESMPELNEDFFLILFSELEILNSYIHNNFDSINLYESELLKFSLLLIASSLFFKLTIAPFHLWAVSVYENSPSPSTFFFAVVPKISLFVLFIRIFFYSFSGFIDYFRYIFVIFVILSAIVGSFGGISQKKLKSLLVYSSISHMGYCIMALCVGTNESVQMLFCYLIVYSFSGICVWAILISLNLKTSYLNKHNKDLTDFSLLSSSNYTMAIFFGAALFSVAGLPPMVGFLVKISLFLTAVESSLYFITFVSMLTSVIATFYYLKLIKIIYFENKLTGKLYYPIQGKSAILISILFLMFIYSFLNPTFLYLIALKVNLSTTAFI